MATKVTIVVPDSPGPGAWVDCAGLGPEPLAQLTRGATNADQIRIETAADNAGAIGIVAASTPLVAASPIVVDRPVSWVRAVRISGPTPGLEIVLRSTNVAGGGGGGGGSQPSSANKNMSALTTAADGDPATAAVVAATPVGWIGVVVNGLIHAPGDATTAASCYFSGDGGVTPRAQGSVVAGDRVYWVGSVAGFELDAVTDRVSFLYNVAS
jgi:hypothetical protein